MYLPGFSTHVKAARDCHGSPAPGHTFLCSQRCSGEMTERSVRELEGGGASEPANPRVHRQQAWGGGRPPLLAWPRSEVLLPPLLGLNGIQDRLPLRLVLLPDLLNLLLHHGVQGQEPLLKVLHCPALELGERWKVQSRQSPGQRQDGEAQHLQTPRGRGEEDQGFFETAYPWTCSKR